MPSLFTPVCKKGRVENPLFVRTGTVFWVVSKIKGMA